MIVQNEWQHALRHVKMSPYKLQYHVCYRLNFIFFSSRSHLLVLWLIHNIFFYFFSCDIRKRWSRDFFLHRSEWERKQVRDDKLVIKKHCQWGSDAADVKNFHFRKTRSIGRMGWWKDIWHLWYKHEEFDCIFMDYNSRSVSNTFLKCLFQINQNFHLRNSHHLIEC